MTLKITQMSDAKTRTFIESSLKSGQLPPDWKVLSIAPTEANNAISVVFGSPDALQQMIQAIDVHRHITTEAAKSCDDPTCLVHRHSGALIQ